MAKRNFNLFDLIYFCGERMRQDGGIPKERGKSSGALMLAFPLLGIIVAVLDKTWRIEKVGWVVVVALLALFWLVWHHIDLLYKKDNRAEDVRQRYYFTVFDKRSTSTLVCLVVMLVTAALFVLTIYVIS